MRACKLRVLYDRAVNDLLRLYPQLNDRKLVEQMWGNIRPYPFDNERDVYVDIKDQLETQLEQLENMDFWD